MFDVHVWSTMRPEISTGCVSMFDVRVWRAMGPEISTARLFQTLSTLGFETGSLTELET